MANQSNALSGDALRRLLSNAYVTAVRPADVMIDHPSGEIFRSNGVYERVRGRTADFGTYEFQGNSVCVQGQGLGRRCRTVARRPDGTYLLIDTSDGSSERVTIEPLR